MIYTTTLSSKGQFTVPLPVRKKLAADKGTKFNVQLLPQGGFIARPKRKSNIMKFAGNLAHLDKGESFEEIKRIASEKMAKDYIKKLGWK